MWNFYSLIFEYGRSRTEGSLETLSKSTTLDVEDFSELFELIENLSKDNLTLPSWNSIISLNWVLGFGGIIGSGFTAPSRIHSSGREISFHWIGLGITVFDFVRSVCKRRVSPFPLWNLCFVANADCMAL